MYLRSSMKRELVAHTPDEMFSIGESLSAELSGGEVVLLYGGLGAGKTLLTKGIMSGLGYDVDEVSSPSFALVNLYRTGQFNVYHIDLWRLDADPDPATSVGLDEILEEENAIVIIEWAERLGRRQSDPATSVHIVGHGDEPRTVTIA